MKRVSVLTILLFPFCTTRSLAQVSVKATLDSTHLLIGDQMKLHLEVSHPPGYAVQPPDVKTYRDSTIEFLDQSTWDTLDRGAMLKLRRDLTLTAWDTGYLFVPPVPVQWSRSGETDTVFTEAIPIRVEAPKTDTTLADIKPIITEPAKWQDYLPYAALVLALGLIAWWFFVLRKKKTVDQPPPPTPVRLMPHELALQKLEALKKEKLWQQGRVKEYHSELTYIIREYLEQRFGITALENTTDEILGQLRRMRFEESLTAKLTTMLQTADLVKFAKAEPPADFHERAMAMSYDFVQATKMVETMQQLPDNEQPVTAAAADDGAAAS
jgi:hypothetical protein